MKSHEKLINLNSVHFKFPVMEKHEDEERFFLQGVPFLTGCSCQMFENLLYSFLHSHDVCQKAGSPERHSDIQNTPVWCGGMADGISGERIDVSPGENVPSFSPPLTYFRFP